MVRKFMREVLESNGYEVDDAPDGYAGMQCYRQQPYALIITDILMPNKDGLEVILELKGMSPDIPIIAVSGGGKSFHEDKKAWSNFLLDTAKKLGAVKVFEKPFIISQFLDTVQKLLANTTSMTSL